MKYIKLFENFNESDIHEICKKYDIENYTINEDRSIDVEGDVTFYDKGLTKLPLKFRNVSGGFYCNHNQLISLKGCPESVGGYFDCENNKLTTLKGCPKSVSNNFYCGSNNLTSLEFCSKYVGGSFWLNNNQLTSLEYCPKTINGNFICSNNQLISLEYCPKTINGNFICSNNNLTSLKFCPKTINGNFICNNNYIRDFKYFVEPGGILFCEGNPIYEIWKLFENISYIELLNDYDFIRGEDIVIDRLNQFLEEIDKPTVESVDGYNNI